MLPYRGRTEEGHEHPRVPRRSARYRRHYRRGAHERLAHHRPRHCRHEGGGHGRGRRRHGLRPLLRLHGREAGKHLHVRYPRPHPQGPYRPFRRADDLCPGRTRARLLHRRYALRRHEGRKPLPRPFRPRHPQARHAQGHGRKPRHLRLRQPRAGNRLRRGQGRAPRRHHGYGPFRLPQPGQQRLRLPLHLPRRAGRARQQDQRGNENSRRPRPGRARPRTRARRGARRLPRPQFLLRPGIHHSHAPRSAHH